MYEGRLHEGKPANIPEAGQGNSFRRTIRSVKSSVQAGEREENSSLISPVGARLIILKQRSRRKKSRRDFISSCCWQRWSINASPNKNFTKLSPEGRQGASRPYAILPGRYLPPTAVINLVRSRFFVRFSCRDDTVVLLLRIHICKIQSCVRLARDRVKSRPPRPPHNS
jgi:hypothetical protein